MNLNTILKISLITTLLLGFSACDDSEENKSKASLPKPEWDEDFSKQKGIYGSLWHESNENSLSATKIGFAYSEELKDYKKAIEWYKYANSMQPSGENSNYTCYAYQQLKEFNEAISWCKQAVELGNDEALILLGSNYNSLKNHKEAITIYKKAYDKKLSEASNNLGYTYSSMGNYKEAEKWYLTAIKEGNLGTYQNIATLYHDKLKDDIKASAYALALIDTKYLANSVVQLLVDNWKIPPETIKKGYELQLNSPDFPIKFEGDLGVW